MVSLLPCVYLGIGSELLLAMRKVSFEPPQSTAPPSLHCLWKGPRVHSDMVRGQGPSLFLLSPRPGQAVQPSVGCSSPGEPLKPQLCTGSPSPPQAGRVLLGGAKCRRLLRLTSCQRQRAQILQPDNSARASSQTELSAEMSGRLPAVLAERAHWSHDRRQHT